MATIKFIHSADWHVGMENYSKIDPETGLSSRLSDFVKSINFLVEFALTEKVDFFLFAGDAFKTREPTPTHQREFAKAVLKLSQNGIPVVLLVGNHDTPNAFGKANSLDIYSALQVQNVHVIREPSLIEIKGVQIAGLPWLSRAEFGEAAEMMDKVYKNVKPDLPLVVTAHVSVEGSVFGSERTVSLGGDLVVAKETLIKHPNTIYVALGHIHKRQVISNSKKIPIVYSGSVERVDFGEEKETKSFELVEINGLEPATHKPIETPARRFLTIITNIKEGDSDPTETILKEISKQDCVGAIVKVVVNFPPDSPAEIRINDIRHALEKCFVLAGISKNIDRTSRATLGKDVNTESFSPIELLEKYFETRNFEKSRISTLKEYARKLMDNQ